MPGNSRNAASWDGEMLRERDGDAQDRRQALPERQICHPVDCAARVARTPLGFEESAVEVQRRLEVLGVDFIERGFVSLPRASQADCLGRAVR